MAGNFSNVGPTCQKIADMMKYGREIVDKWPRFYRDDLGVDIKREMREMLRLATKARLKYYSKTTLTELDTEKEILKVYLREANETTFRDKRGEMRKLLSNHTYGVERKSGGDRKADRRLDSGGQGRQGRRKESIAAVSRESNFQGMYHEFGLARSQSGGSCASPGAAATTTTAATSAWAM